MGRASLRVLSLCAVLLGAGILAFFIGKIHPPREGDAHGVDATTSLGSKLSSDGEKYESTQAQWRERDLPLDGDYHDFDPAFWRVHILPSPVSSYMGPRSDCPFLTRPTADAIPLFRKLLKDEDFLVRVCTLHCIGRLGNQAGPIVPDIVELLKDPDRYVRPTAMGTLGILGATAVQAVPALLEFLQGNDPNTRRTAAFALSRIDPKKTENQVIPVLIVLATGKQPSDHRREAIDALGRFRFDDDRVSATLIRCLHEPGDSIFGLEMEAIIAIGDCGRGSEKAVVTLKEILKNGSLERRTQAAYSLYKLTSDGQLVMPVLAEYCSTHPSTDDPATYFATLTLVSLAKKDPGAMDLLVGLCTTNVLKDAQRHPSVLGWVTAVDPKLAEEIRRRIDGK